MKKIYYNAIRLKKFFNLIGKSKEVEIANLLSTNESLKNFGRAWNGNNGGDVMMMLEIASHEYRANNSYSENEMNAVKYALSRIASFMRECGKEWNEFEEKQQSKPK